LQDSEFSRKNLQALQAGEPVTEKCRVRKCCVLATENGFELAQVVLVSAEFHSNQSILWQK
jgi:hypothetical protein